MFIKKVILKPESLDIEIYNEGLNLLTLELTADYSTSTNKTTAIKTTREAA